MTQMIPEALPVRVDVTPAVAVRVEGPAGLVATLTLPDTDEAWDLAPEFVGALSDAIGEALSRQRVDPEPIQGNESDEAAVAPEPMIRWEANDA